MGAWGIGSFENDDAMDWLDSFEAEGPGAIETALTDVVELSKDDYLESTEACHALAAAELVAAARDGDVTSLPDTFGGQFAEHTEAINEADLAALARRAVLRVLRASELKELWDETDDADEWAESVRELADRLRG